MLQSIILLALFSKKPKMLSLMQKEILWEALWLMSGEWGKLWEPRSFNKNKSS